MLKVGQKTGDIRKVLPACRQLLTDNVSHVRGALNYLLVLGFAVTPAALFIPIVLRVKVLPAYKQVFEGMLEGAPLPALSRWVFAESDLATVVQFATLSFIWLAILAYVGGPGLRSAFGETWTGLMDKVFLLLPWRRKRVYRDFSAMLAILLDAGVPEPEAVTMAAESSANLQIVRRAEIVRARLKEGVKLPQAIRAIDDSKELQWRLANALSRGGDFVRALSGWHEALDAKAFQLEQSAAQVTTTALVLLNGLLVGLLVTAIFVVLIQLINQAVLW
jgi:type II secretory pathway component PulF